MHRAENLGYVTGKIIERELLGEVKKEKYEKYMESSYLPREIAMKVTKECQPARMKDFAASLLAAIKEKLSLEKEDIKFFTSVESHLDYHHGIDAFFEIKVGDKEEVITFDITKNPNKDVKEAEVIGLVPADGLDKEVDEFEFNEQVDIISNQIIRAFESKYGGQSNIKFDGTIVADWSSLRFQALD